MSRPLQAIVFDFDGVIANSEPLHLLAFQQALTEDGIELSASEYYARYLGYDAHVYDGSFEDWSNRAELPVEKSANP